MIAMTVIICRDAPVVDPCSRARTIGGDLGRPLEMNTVAREAARGDDEGVLDPHGAQLRFTFDEVGDALARPNEPQALFVRNPRARRYVLRLLADGTPRVTIPRRGSKREAERFLHAQREWLDRQRASLVDRLARRPPCTWTDGHIVLLRGASHVLRRSDAACRAGVNVDQNALVVTAPDAEEGAPDLRPVVTAWLWQLARVELPARLRALAQRHGLEVKAVSIRNQRTRWGSCAPNGRISLNWRLVPTPDEVCDYVLVHELMHLRQANHSARFWRLVADACPDYQAARQWLRTHERVLLDA
jgi:predicted metal-dependent hydrolase